MVRYGRLVFWGEFEKESLLNSIYSIKVMVRYGRLVVW